MSHAEAGHYAVPPPHPSASAEHNSTHETPRPPSRNGSTSSSNNGSPRSTSMEPGPTIWVEMWENQRWFPVIGWSTSRFQYDLPSFCRAPAGYRLCGAHPADFDAAFNAVNPPQKVVANPYYPAQPILGLRMPAGYRWVGYWEVCKEHRHGTDVGGWRYAEHFFKQHPGTVLSAFKKTQTAMCVVRRRLWRRRVAVVMGEEDGSAFHDGDLYLTEEDMQSRSYLSDMEEEMAVAETSKNAEAAAAQAGSPWSTEQELAAEEELRKFCRQRRSRESATRMRSTNPSFANPFHENTDAFHISPTNPPPQGRRTETAHSGAEAAASWASEGHPTPSPAQHEDLSGGGSSSSPTAGRAAEATQAQPVLFQATSTNTPSRVDGDNAATASRVNRFVSASPTGPTPMRPDAGDLVAQNTVDGFVLSTPTERNAVAAAEAAAEASMDGPGVVVGGITSPTGAEFRAIFSQFMTPGPEKPTE